MQILIESLIDEGARITATREDGFSLTFVLKQDGCHAIFWGTAQLDTHAGTEEEPSWIEAFIPFDPASIVPPEPAPQ